MSFGRCGAVVRSWVLPCRLEVARPLDRDSRWAWRWRCCFGGDCACCRGRVVALTLWGCAAVCIGRGRGCLRGCSLLQDGLCAEGRKEASKERPVCRHGGAGGAGGCAVWEDCRQALAHPTALIAEDQLGLCCSTVETATLIYGPACSSGCDGYGVPVPFRRCTRSAERRRRKVFGVARLG